MTSSINGFLEQAADAALEKASAALDYELPGPGHLYISERAKLRNIAPSGRISAGGASRLIDCADGRIALTLSRDEDWSLIPAWLEADVKDWAGIEEDVSNRMRDPLVERGVEIGLPIAADKPAERPDHWFTYQASQTRAFPHRCRVIDMSPLWAGPLASRLLLQAGHEVIRIEGWARPDGLRSGHAGFNNRLNAGKASVAINLPEEVGRLHALLETADILITGSRPRVLGQLDLTPARFPHLLIASLSAYGTNRIGFGDDIGVAAGLSVGREGFIGDAIADPLSGLHLAQAIAEHVKAGRAGQLNVVMCDVVKCAIDGGKPLSAFPRVGELPVTSGQVRALGADNDLLPC